MYFQFMSALRNMKLLSQIASSGYNLWGVQILVSGYLTPGFALAQFPAFIRFFGGRQIKSMVQMTTRKL
jgi:hypothetical protein